MLKYLLPAALVFVGTVGVTLAGAPPCPEEAAACCKPVVVEAPSCAGSCAGERESCAGRQTMRDRVNDRRCARIESRAEARANRASARSCAGSKASCAGRVQLVAVPVCCEPAKACESCSSACGCK